jgi:hypothetical protein
MFSRKRHVYRVESLGSIVISGLVLARVPIADSLPRSTYRYSSLADQLCANIHSAPAPAVQPTLLLLTLADDAKDIFSFSRDNFTDEKPGVCRRLNTAIYQTARAIEQQVGRDGDAETASHCAEPRKLLLGRNQIFKRARLAPR